MAVERVGERDFVAGTVHLVDLEGIMRAKHASGAGKKDVVLVPAPSSDPDDPLNWTPRRKLMSTVCVNVYTLMVGIASAAIYAVLVPISLDTGISVKTLNEGTGYMFLFFGWGCLIWQPLALQYGKRPVYIFSIFATMAIQIWAPYTKSNGQWIANKILQGFFGAPIESLCEITVTDVYFTHERGYYIALYGLFLAGSNFFAPIISGFIADDQGWQWVLYWCAIFNAIGGIFLIFFMEETNYSRSTIAGQESEMNSGTQTPREPVENGDKLADVDEKQKLSQPSSNEDSYDIANKPTTTFFQKMRPFAPGTFSKPFQIPGMMLRPLIFLSFPVIAYSGFCYGSNLVWFNVLNAVEKTDHVHGDHVISRSTNATASLILAETYGFSASMVGVAYVSPLIGVFIGAAFTGWFGDWFIIHFARTRGKGIYEPEYRLWLFLSSAVLIPFGLILWGVGAYHHVQWFGCIFAMGVIALTNTVGLQISVSYCIDSYRELAGESIVTVILIRNTMSFAIGYGVTPWVTNMGYQNAFILAAFVGLAQVMTFLIFVKWGKTFRRQTTPKYLRYVKEIVEKGGAH